jgi:hypothetical protein
VGTIHRACREQLPKKPVRAFSPSTNVLRCVGTVEGAPCSHNFEVDLQDAAFVRSHLGFLHLDHEVEVHKTCSRWRANLSPDPVSWDDGVDGAALCQALFHVGCADGEAMGALGIRFRCGPQRDGADRWMPYGERAFCHRL